MDIATHSIIDTSYETYGCSVCLVTGPRYSGCSACDLRSLFTQALTSSEISTRQHQPIFIPIFRPQTTDYNTIVEWLTRIGHPHYHHPHYQFPSDDTDCDSSSDDNIPIINHLFTLDASSLPTLVHNDGSLSSASSVSSDGHLDLTSLEDELYLIDRMNSSDLQSLFAAMSAENVAVLDTNAVNFQALDQQSLPLLNCEQLIVNQYS